MLYETAQELFNALCSPFPVEMVEWRVGSTNKDKTKCLPLCYIDARTVMDRLDAICGPDGWQNNYTAGVGGSIVCNIGLSLPGNTWGWKADGAGATDIEGEKGALSDAFKRAAVRWGVGRYLYEMKAPWVELQDHKYIPDAARKELNLLYEEFAERVGWGDRPGVYVYRLLRKMIEQTVTDPIQAQDFKKSNEGYIAQLPAAMRRHLFETLDRIGGGNQEAA